MTRVKEAVILPCLFGCSGAIDRQAHYIMCPFLLALQRFLWGPISEVAADPLKRLALKDTCCNTVKLVACTFSAYHHVKFTYSARFHSGGDLDPSNVIPDEALTLFYRSFAEVFKTEASELGLQTRSFDLATFYSYLNGQSAIEDSSSVANYETDIATQTCTGTAGAGPRDPGNIFENFHGVPGGVPGGVHTSTRNSNLFKNASTSNPGRSAAPSAPSVPTGRASGRFFVPASSADAHNPFLHTSRAAPTRNAFDRTAASAPGGSSSRAGTSTFVRAAQVNAHNPILHANDAHNPFLLPTGPAARPNGGEATPLRPNPSNTPSAPRHSSRRAGVGSAVFVRAAQANAHNPFLHANGDVTNCGPQMRRPACSANLAPGRDCRTDG